MVSLPAQIKSDWLKKVISEKSHLPENELAIFKNGKRIDTPEPQGLALQEKNIIHVVNIKRTILPIITVFFRMLTNVSQIISLNIKSNQQIINVLKNEINQYIKKD